MNSVLLEAFRHNSWATRTVLNACRDLREEQLASHAIGTYGDVTTTINHLILAEAAYQRRLTGSATDWVDDDGTNDFDVLLQRVDELEHRWEALLAGPVDAEEVHPVDNGRHEVRAGVIFAQVLHHGDVHREQISSILTSLGIEPPDLQPWEYAWDTGRIWATSSEA